MSRSVAEGASWRKATAAAAACRRGGGAVADVQQSGVGSAMRASLKLRKFDRGTTGTLSEVHIAGVGGGGEEQNRAVPCAHPRIRPSGQNGQRSLGWADPGRALIRVRSTCCPASAAMRENCKMQVARGRGKCKLQHLWLPRAACLLACSCSAWVRLFWSALVCSGLLSLRCSASLLRSPCSPCPSPLRRCPPSNGSAPPALWPHGGIPLEKTVTVACSEI
jgi:hypothetical protein